MTPNDPPPIYVPRPGGIAEILKEIEASRRAIGRDYASLRQDLNFKSRTQESIKTRPLAWLGGAAGLGWLLAGRKKKRLPKASTGKTAAAVENAPVKSLGILGVLLAAFRILLPILRPAATAYAAKKFADLAGRLK